MKKILTFISILIFSTIAYADNAGMSEFRNWLIKNGHTANFKTVETCKNKKNIVKNGMKVVVRLILMVKKN